MKRFITPIGLAAAIAGLAWLIMHIFGMTSDSDYDYHAWLLTAARMAVLALYVMFIMKLIALIEGDDIEEDWKRIDSGNVATAVFRGLEFASLVIAAAMLIAKV